MNAIRRWLRRHHKLTVAMAIVFGYLLHLTVEGMLFGYLGAYAQSAGWITV